MTSTAKSVRFAAPIEAEPSHRIDHRTVLAAFGWALLATSCVGIVGSDTTPTAPPQTSPPAPSTPIICSEPMPGTCANPRELAFVRLSDRQIYRVRADGSGLTRLTREGENRSPTWSPDGRRIAFVRRSGAGIDGGDVWRMDADGSNLVQLTRDGGYNAVTWSPDGSRLAMSDNGTYYSSVWVIGADGGLRTLVANDAANPAWSPDGRQIAFVRVSGDDCCLSVWVTNIDGTGARPLTAPNGIIYWGIAWSSDGLSVAYTDGGRMRRVNVDGSDNREIPSDGSVQGADLSPDGRWLAVMVASPGPWNPAVGFMPIEGGLVRIVVPDGFDATWRP
jgi:Tol biopolymer transport system component